MKRVSLCILTVLLLASVSLLMGKGKEAKGAGGKSSNIEEHIKKLEQDWANAIAKGDTSAVELYEAADIVSTDPSGRVTDRAQDMQDVKSGDLKFESLQLSDVKVRVYGNTAVATGTGNLKGSYKGQDISGTYRFTDTWVNRGGKWQCVATQATRVMSEAAAK